MKSIWADEEGITLVELLAGLALLGLILMPLNMLLSVSADSVNIQREQANIQSTANLMVAQMLDISQREGLYKQAGYADYGKIEWDKNHLLKINGNGTEKIEITDIADTGNQRKKTYQVGSPDVTIHIEQTKNANNQRKTNQGLSNSRDTFTIQETVDVRFEKKDKVLYAQQIELDFRDEDKAKANIGGDGWW